MSDSNNNDDLCATIFIASIISAIIVTIGISLNSPESERLHSNLEGIRSELSLVNENLVKLHEDLGGGFLRTPVHKSLNGINTNLKGGDDYSSHSMGDLANSIHREFVKLNAILRKKK